MDLRNSLKTSKNSKNSGPVSFSFVSTLTNLRQISAQKKSGSAQKEHHHQVPVRIYAFFVCFEENRVEKTSLFFERKHQNLLNWSCLVLRLQPSSCRTPSCLPNTFTVAYKLPTNHRSRAHLRLSPLPQPHNRQQQGRAISARKRGTQSFSSTKKFER